MNKETINTQGLEIGNWFDFDGKQGTIDAITENYISMTGVGIISFKKPFSPIKLTEDWLIKLGFVFVYDNIWCMPTTNISFDLIRWSFDDKTKNGFYLCIGEKPQYNKLEFVHQLQNLYLILTREELLTK